MALLINYTKFIPRFIGAICQRGIRCGNGRVFYLRASSVRTIRFNEILCRTAVSLAKENLYHNNDVEDMVFRLSEDIRIRNVFFNNVKDVFLAVKETGKITDSQFLLFMKCCSEISLLSSPAERVNFAEDVWLAAAESGMNFTITHYNALLKVFVDCNHTFSSTQFLNNLREKGLEPNVNTLNKLLKAHCQIGDSEGANKILEEMKKMNFPLSPTEFTSLIQCYAISGDFDKSKEILKLMEDKDIDPSEWAYTYLLCGYAKHGKIEEIKEMLDDLPKKCVKFSNLHLAEIVYALATNGQNAHIQIVMDKMTPNFSDNKFTLRVIHRLIREKHDTVAFQLFEKLNTIDITFDNLLINSKLILKHFALYREPVDILKAIEKMKNKEWCETGLSIVLRQIYKYKSEDFCVEFLKTMMNMKLRVGSHYFWPALIKASKKSNEKVLKILRIINPLRLGDCQHTTTRILYLHYNISDDWRADFDSLYNAGCPAKWLSITFIKLLAQKYTLKEALEVAAKYPVDTRRSTDIFKFLVTHIQKYPDQTSDFVDMMHYLNHDTYLERMRKLSTSNKEGNTDEDSLNVNTAYENALFSLGRSACREEVLEKFLENMIEKQNWISSETLDIALLQYPSKFHEALKKLTNPEFKWKPDDDVLNSKKSWTSIKKKSTDEFESNEPQDATATILLFSRMKYFKKLEKVLPELKEDKSVIKRALWRSLIEWMSKERLDLAEEILNVGVKACVLSRKEDTLDMIRVLISKGFSAQAVKKYRIYVEETKNAAKNFDFMMKLAQQDDETVLNDFIDIISQYLSRNQLLTSLLIAYVSAEKLDKAREVMARNAFTINSRVFYKHITVKFQFISSKTLENFWEVLKNRTDIDKIDLYKFLLRKYAAEKELDKVKSLWVFVEEDDITNYSFLEQLRDLVDNPSLEALEELAATFEKEDNRKIHTANEET